MKRLIFYILITALVLWLPVHGTDVGKLRPVQLVAIFREGQQVVIATDTGDRGAGASAEAALAKLHATTPAIVYLDTAEFFLIEEDAQEDARYLADFLKGNVQTYENGGIKDLRAAAEYLSVHQGGIRLEQWKEGALLPIVEENEGRFILFKNNKIGT